MNGNGYKSKILSWLLAVALVVTIVPMGFVASGKSASALTYNSQLKIFTDNGGGAGVPGQVNAVDGNNAVVTSGNYAGGSWSYNINTNTLSLNNYGKNLSDNECGGYIDIYCMSIEDNPLTIELTGTNKIRGLGQSYSRSNIGAFSINETDVIIRNADADKRGVLDISAQWNGISVTSILGSGNSLTVDGTTLKVDSLDGLTYTCGFLVYDYAIKLTNDANLLVSSRQQYDSCPDYFAHVFSLQGNPESLIKTSLNVGPKATFIAKATSENDSFELRAIDLYDEPVLNFDNALSIVAGDSEASSIPISSTDLPGTYAYVKAAPNAPTITTSNNGAIYPDAEATVTPLSVTATGTGVLSYQWYKSDSRDTLVGTALDGGNKASFTPTLTMDHGEYYYCVVSDDNGTAVSEPAYILTGSETPTISEQPQGGTYGLDEDFTDILSVTATGEASDLYTYQWYKNDVNSNEGGELIPDAINSTYTPSIDWVGTEYYYVVVSCGNNSVTSSVAKLNIMPALPYLIVNGTVAASDGKTVAPGGSFEGGTWSYDDEDKILTLNDYGSFGNMELGAPDVTGGSIDSTIDGLTVVLKGENIINDYNYAVRSDGDISFKGDGALYCTAKNNSSSSDAIVGVSVFGGDMTVDTCSLYIGAFDNCTDNDCSLYGLFIDNGNLDIDSGLLQTKATIEKNENTNLFRYVCGTENYSGWDSEKGNITVNSGCFYSKADTGSAVYEHSYAIDTESILGKGGRINTSGGICGLRTSVMDINQGCTVTSETDCEGGVAVLVAGMANINGGLLKATATGTGSTGLSIQYDRYGLDVSNSGRVYAKGVQTGIKTGTEESLCGIRLQNGVLSASATGLSEDVRGISMNCDYDSDSFIGFDEEESSSDVSFNITGNSMVTANVPSGSASGTRAVELGNNTLVTGVDASSNLIMAGNSAFTTKPLPAGTSSSDFITGTDKYVSVTPSKPLAPGSFKAAVAGYNSNKLTWSAVPNANGYSVYRYNPYTGEKTLLKDISGATLSYNDTGLATGTKYYYVVRAYKQVGTDKWMSNSSVSVNATPYLGTGSITKLSKYSKKKIKVGWSKVAGASGYQLMYGTNSSMSKGKAQYSLNGYSAVSKTTPNLTKGKTYYFKVRAYRVVNGKTVYGAWSSVKKLKR